MFKKLYSWRELFLVLFVLFFVWSEVNVAALGSDISDLENEFGDIIFGDDLDENKIDLSKYDSHTRGFGDVTFWKKLGVSRNRDPLFLIPSRRLTLDKDGIVCNLFFNMSDRLQVSPDIVLNTNAIDIFEPFLSSGTFGDDNEVADIEALLKVLPFIRNMTIQERRVGGMLQAGFSWGRFSLQLDTLLLLVERNFWLKNKKEREDFLRISSELDALGSGEVKRVRCGLGDSRLKLGYKVVDTQWVKANIGVEGILPTSRIGKKKPDSIVKTKPGDERKKLINDLLNVSKHIMIEPSLGTGHWGLGCFLDMRMNIIPKTLDFWSRLSFDYLFSGREWRFIPSSKEVPVSVLRQLTSSTIPQDFPINDLFPYLVSARVYPGSIFNATIGFDWTIKNWKLGIGYDFYAQQEERLSGISAFNIDSSLLKIDHAVSSQIMQHKVFGDINYNLRCRGFDVNFGVGGDITFSSHGASRDWTVLGKVGITF